MHGNEMFLCFFFFFFEEPIAEFYCVLLSQTFTNEDLVFKKDIVRIIFFSAIPR